MEQMTSPDPWRVAEVAGVWMGAIATFAASAIALWLSGQQMRVKLGLRAAAALEFDQTTKEQFSKIWITVTNLSMRPTTVTSIGWTMRPFIRDYFQQTFDDPRSFKVPGELRDGQKADFYLSTSGENSDWYDYFASKAFSDRSRLWVWLSLRRLRVFATTASGKHFQAAPEKSFRDKLAEAARRLEKRG